MKNKVTNTYTVMSNFDNKIVFNKQIKNHKTNETNQTNKTIQTHQTNQTVQTHQTVQPHKTVQTHKTNEILDNKINIDNSSDNSFDNYTDADSEIETNIDSDSECGDLEYIDVECDSIDLDKIFLTHKSNLSRQTSEDSDTLKYINLNNDVFCQDSDSANSANSTKEKINDHLYCNKCLMKKQSGNTVSKIEIFNVVNEIIFSSSSMPEVYEKMDKLIIRLDKWFELNDDGLSVFHWFIWYISTKIKKYNYVKSRVFAFFQKVFSDNTVRSVFGSSMLKKILTLGTPSDPKHTLLYHLVRYCENPNDVFYNRTYNLLLERGAKPLTDEQINEIKKLNSEEEDIPPTLKHKISSITDKYKLDESKIVEDIEKNHTNYKLNKCIECEVLIDYTKEIPKIISYARTNNCDFLLNNIWSAYYQRKLVNTIFDKYYSKVNAQSNLNMIHQRHTHILDVYRKNLIESSDSESPVSIISIYSDDSDTLKSISQINTNQTDSSKTDAVQINVNSSDKINSDINKLIPIPKINSPNVKCLG